jgi:uncharacterized membrane protein
VIAVATTQRVLGCYRTERRVSVRILTAGFVLGVGLGGFVDGIVLHQIVQWHNMLSAIVPPVTIPAMHLNMLWDGLFHAATWLVTFVGVWMLWADQQASAPTPRVLTGQMLLGWGAFNLVEGIIDHHLLDLHHVRDVPAHVPAYDWAFLGLGGILLIGAGARLAAPYRARTRG